MENEVLAACLFTQVFTREPQCAKMEQDKGCLLLCLDILGGERKWWGEYYSVQGQKTCIEKDWFKFH